MPRIYYQRVSRSDLSRRRKYLGMLLGYSWKRWSREHITELRDPSRRKSTPERIISVTLGDNVIAFEDNLPCSQWRLRRVDTRLMPGADDCARAALVKFIAKRGKPFGMKGSIQRLFHLEVPVMTSNEQL